MAKLNARGRVELLRLEFVEFWPERGRPDTVRKISRQRVYMSDGHVLEKTTWHTTKGTVDFSVGWNDLGKTATRDLDAVRRSYFAQGWKEVGKGGSASGQDD